MQGVNDFLCISNKRWKRDASEVVCFGVSNDDFVEVESWSLHGLVQSLFGAPSMRKMKNQKIMEKYGMMWSIP